MTRAEIKECRAAWAAAWACKLKSSDALPAKEASLVNRVKPLLIISRKGAKQKTQRARGIQRLRVLPLRLCARLYIRYDSVRDENLASIKSPFCRPCCRASCG